MNIRFLLQNLHLGCCGTILGTLTCCWGEMWSPKTNEEVLTITLSCMAGVRLDTLSSLRLQMYRQTWYTGYTHSQWVICLCKVVQVYIDIIDIYLPVCLSVYLSFYLSICLSVCLSIYLSIYVGFVYLFISNKVCRCWSCCYIHTNWRNKLRQRWMLV